MRALGLLHRLARRRLERLSVEIAAVRAECDRLRTAQAVLMAREQSEMDLAAGDLALAPLLPAYRARVHAEGLSLARSLEAAERDIERLRAEIEDAYGEKARLEVLIEEASRRARAEREVREQAALDESAVIRAARSRSEVDIA